MSDPHGPPVIPGTRGVRKIRFSPSGWPTGKSGARRALYAYFEEHKRVVMALVYPKGQKENISQDDKRRLNRAIQEIEHEFNQ